MKKYLSLVLAALLIVGVLAGCGEQGNTQAPDNSSAPIRAQATLPADGSFTSEEYEKLLALRFDGYEEMTVAEFRDRVGATTDTKEYTSLFERLSQSVALQDMKDTDEAAAFLFYTLMPLTDENWQTKAFNGAAITEADTSAILEYGYTLTIADENTLTIREYNAAQKGITDGLQAFLSGKAAAELQDEAAMQTAIGNEIATLTKSWGSEKLEITIEYVFRCENPPDGTPNDNDTPAPNTETRQSEYGTKEDYQSLLALKTPDYASMSVADFNAKLLAWANEDFSRMERIDADMLCNDFQVSFSEEELAFIRLTVFLSGTENGEFVQSNYTGDPMVAPAYQESLPQKVDKSNEKAPMWCDFGYRFLYHIANQETLTVGERDRCIGGMITAVEKFWNDTTLDDLLTMTKDDVISCLNSLAAEYSTDDIVITISAEHVHFDHTEERPELP
ncbi:LptM family lipoprotein [Lawsonibacter sp. JLR.KK007]|uniref:LptM family lipoprotein n=2 Tax=Bacteria TaxID=2 RepID=UPI002FF369B5